MFLELLATSAALGLFIAAVVGSDRLWRLPEPVDDVEESVAMARKAAELAPTAANYWLLASACRKYGDVASALAALDLAIKIDPGNLQYRQAYDAIKDSKPTNPGAVRHSGARPDE
jgi:hypothetical protein